MKATARLSQFAETEEAERKAGLEKAGLIVTFLRVDDQERHGRKAAVYEVTFPEGTIMDQTQMEAVDTSSIVYTTPDGVHLVQTVREEGIIGLLLLVNNRLFDLAFQYDGCTLPSTHWERRKPA